MQTRITTRVIVYDEDKILLCRNHGQHFWYPGGGGLEDNEDLIQCCKREVLEETNQEIEVLDLMYIQEYYLQEEKKRNIELFFLAKPKKQIQENQDHKDTDTDDRPKVVENRWFSQADIEKDNIKIYPLFIKEKFWKDVIKFDKDKKTYWKGVEGN